MNDKFIILLVSACIAGLLVELLVIAIKLYLFRTKSMAKEFASIDLKANLWAVGALAFFVSMYFFLF